MITLEQAIERARPKLAALWDDDLPALIIPAEQLEDLTHYAISGNTQAGLDGDPMAMVLDAPYAIVDKPTGHVRVAAYLDVSSMLDLMTPVGG